ncbi:ParB/RepB/Spo0J family partition protein [Thalassoroseus pseudoceratinae]|uniref:ParB/RepB/Spo0J family partition protein n=1 Tax=Thalassoroseus pseudoceratinae TaxID=2713176 RepID=UPI0014214B01|nr:hypothetical protein [Thalassoroseus pseudoceratinae]
MSDKYRIFPVATKQERAELRASIEAVGLRNSIVLDEYGQVIDGHERRDVCTELGIDWMAGADVRIGLSDDEKKALAIDLNLWRRPMQLPRRVRNKLIEIYLVANPELSETTVAELFGVSQPTINRRRKELIQMNKLPPAVSTVGKDGVRRKIGKRKGARLIVKSQREFESLTPDLEEMKDDLQGIIRRPKRFASEARRKRRLREIEDVKNLPPNISIRNSDWRKLKIKQQSVDLLLTDVVWSKEHYQDWAELGVQAKKWLKADGLFASYIGTSRLSEFCQAIGESLSYLTTIAIVFKAGSKDYKTGHIERWRPVPIFSPNPDRQYYFDDVIYNPGIEKDYGDWQQSLPVARQLVLKLSDPENLIVDTHLGTGTNAVAVSQVGEGRQFVGCDIDADMVRIARHRVATEGIEEMAS